MCWTLPAGLTREGYEPTPDPANGQSAGVNDSGARPYLLKNVGGVDSTPAEAWFFTLASEA